MPNKFKPAKKTLLSRYSKTWYSFLSLERSPCFSTTNPLLFTLLFYLLSCQPISIPPFIVRLFLRGASVVSLGAGGRVASSWLGKGGSGFWLVVEYQCGECWNSSYKRISRCFQSSFKQISSSMTVWARIHFTFFCWNLGLEYRHKCLDCSASCSNYGKIFLIIAGRYQDLYLKQITQFYTLRW